MKYAWIQEHDDSFAVGTMCDVLGVSTSGYYGSLQRKPSARAKRHERIKRCVVEVLGLARIHRYLGVPWSGMIVDFELGSSPGSAARTDWVSW